MDSLKQPLDQVTWSSRFVSSLSGDEDTDNAARQVWGAVYSIVAPTPVQDPRIIAWSEDVANQLGLETPDPYQSVAAAILGGTVLPPAARPYAACYGGHQFGNWAGQLGDGRAITLGEVTGSDGVLLEIQLKGAGPTPYSRRGDGRAVLRSSIREYVASEAMYHLGVPTTRALALVLTGEQVMRDIMYDGSPELEPGAVVTRVAPSFLRFGNFEIFAARGETGLLRSLADWTVQQHFPHLVGIDGAYVQMFAEIAANTAAMIVEWSRVGFVHGVMNTDNMSVHGITIDYGPYGWLDAYDPYWTPNTTDLPGRRYCFGRQAAIAQWNLKCLARALAPLVEDHEAEQLERLVVDFAPDFLSRYEQMLAAKIGLGLECDAADLAVATALHKELFTVFTEIEVDMTIFYRLLATLPEAGAAEQVVHMRDAFYNVDEASDCTELSAWLHRYMSEVTRRGVERDVRESAMNGVNPLYVPRNYLLFQVIKAAESGDYGPLTEFNRVLTQPYHYQSGMDRWCAKRPDWAREQVGCSMLSCSS